MKVFVRALTELYVSQSRVPILQVLYGDRPRGDNQVSCCV